MTTSKIPPPRKLTESEDIDSFDDWWFQAVCYYGRDENFKEFFDTPDFTWQAKSVPNRGLTSALKAANLTCLLRALATHTIGPYIKTNITDKARSLDDVKNEFLKFLEIEVNDFSALHWFTIQRKQTERPLVFFYRLRYHMAKHLVKRDAIIEGVALLADETLSPSLERLIVMEWLHRMDPRLIQFVQEKFSTELSAGSTVLATMVETLAKNIDSYIATLNASKAIGAVSPPNPSSTDSPDQEKVTLAYQGAYRYDLRGGFHERSGFLDQGLQPRRGFHPRLKRSGREYQSSSSNCEYCFIQSKTRNVDFNHPIARCPEMAALHGSVDMLDNETNISEDEHDFESSAHEFIELNNWQDEIDEIDLEKKVTFNEPQELTPMNIMNITGIVSNDESIETIPWTPVIKLPIKPREPPLHLTLQGQHTLSHELVNQSQQSQTSPGNLIRNSIRSLNSIQTLAIPSADLSLQTESDDEDLVADNSEVASAVALQVEVNQLKNEVAALVFMNNRYHLAISNCTFCASDDDTSDASISLDASTRASTPVCRGPRTGISSALSSSGPAMQSRTIPALMSLTIDDRIKAEVDTMQKRKDKAFISGMVKTLTKLETKYLNPRHNSKKQLFMRKQNSPSFHLNSDTNQLRSLAKNSVICANVPKPKVSSNDASTEANDDQSDPEAVKSVNISDESRTSQGSLFYQNLAQSSPSPPLANSPSTTDLLLDMSYEVAPLIPAAPLLPKFSSRKPSVISCPADTGDEQVIAINPSPVHDIFLELNDDVIDHVFIGNNSPEVLPVLQQDEETVPFPPPPNTDHKDRPQRGLHCVDYRSLHDIEKERMLGLSQDRRETRRRTQRRTQRRTRRRTQRRRWRTQRTGVRQTHNSSFQIV